MDAEEDDFEEESVEVVAAEEEEMDDDWLIPDGFLTYWTILYCLSIIEQFWSTERSI